MSAFADSACEMKLLDTTVAVDHLRGLPAATGLLVQLAEQGGELAASELTKFELLAGVRPREVGAVEEFFETLLWAPVGDEVARVAGRLAQRFRKSHSGIDDADYLIAATALVLDAALLTTNVRHFPIFTDLAPAY